MKCNELGPSHTHTHMHTFVIVILYVRSWNVNERGRGNYWVRGRQKERQEKEVELEKYQVNKVASEGEGRSCGWGLKEGINTSCGHLLFERISACVLFTFCSRFARNILAKNKNVLVLFWLAPSPSSPLSLFRPLQLLAPTPHGCERDALTCARITHTRSPTHTHVEEEEHHNWTAFVYIFALFLSYCFCPLWFCARVFIFIYCAHVSISMAMWVFMGERGRTEIPQLYLLCKIIRVPHFP